MSIRLLKFSDAIREAQEQCLENDPAVFLIGEGVGDPKNIFGTTLGLKNKYPKRVFDMPISENGMTGVCIGAAVNGLKPILVHQRIDFSLYSMDQIVNNAAKWYSMFGGKRSCPLVIRMIVGRGWGQGNQHSQNLTSLYAQVPGLKIVCPSDAYNAKGLFISAVKDPNPVLFIEHRWLYETTSVVPHTPYETPIGEVIGNDGYDITIVASGHAHKEALKAKRFLDTHDVSVALFDLKTIKPLSLAAVKESVKKTRHLLVIDDGWGFGGIAAEVITQISEDDDIVLLSAPKRLTYPNYPSGSSPALTKNYYPGPADICKTVVKMLEMNLDLSEIIKYQEQRIHDVPDANFRGPF